QKSIVSSFAIRLSNWFIDATKCINTSLSCDLESIGLMRHLSNRVSLGTTGTNAFVLSVHLENFPQNHFIGSAGEPMAQMYLCQRFLSISDWTNPSIIEILCSSFSAQID